MKLGVLIEMINALKVSLLVINIISLTLVAIFGVTGIIYEIFGPAVYESMLNKLKIPWSYEQIWIFMFIILAILIITYYLRKNVLR